MHRHAAAGFDAVEGGEGPAGGLPEEGQGEEETSRTLRVVRASLDLHLQQSLMQQVP